ncbi:restriction endonuclease subunit S [Hydrogenophaga atypica]|uniref:Restriction endonuclease subunit S n=1 Tax=Hydrogenophaga atypica TaxID=249409 RepID=A0ABW2QRH3_9BURK
MNTELREPSAKYLLLGQYQHTEIGPIPTDWEVKRLKDISPNQSVGLVINPSTYFDTRGTVPMLVGSNVAENRIDWEGARRITSESNKRLPASRIYANDLVTVRVGDPGITAVVSREHSGSNCASMMIVRSHPSFDSTWLCHLMNSSYGRSRIESVQYGTAQKQFNISDAVDFQYPVPPLPEQRAIATALSDVDALIAGLERLIAKKRDIKQAAMQQLLTGQTRLPGFLGDWIVKKLGEVADVIDPHPSHRAPDEFPNGIPFLGIGDLDSTGNIVGGKLRLVNPVVLAEHMQRYSLDDALIGLGRVASIGKVVALKRLGEHYAISPTLGVIRGTLAKRDFLLHALKSRFVTDQFTKIMSGSTRSSVGMAVLRELQVLLPSTVREQEAVATVLSDMDADLSALEARLAKTRAIKQGMMQELLTGRTRLV